MTRPVARPLASSMEAENGWTELASSQIGARDDSLRSSSFSRISSSRLDQIAGELTATDNAVLELVASTRLCSGDQLERLFWPDGTPAARARRARRALGRLTYYHILARLPRNIGGRRAGSHGYLYSVGPAGDRLLARRDRVHVKRLVRPGDRFVAHTLAITEVVVGLKLADRDGRLDLIEVQTEPQCWRMFLAGFGARVTLRPDLFVRIGVGAFEDRYFIELDMDTETRGTLIVKAKRCLSYYRSGSEQAEHGVFPAVVWAVPTTRRAHQLAEVFRELGGDSERLFVIWGQDDLLARLSAENAS